MRSQSVLSALLLVTALAAGTARAARAVSPPAAVAAGGDAPWYCHGLECPKFSLTKNMTDIAIELRHYPAAKWVSTSVENKNYDAAVAAGFWRLFKYISGNNRPGVKVDMTAPVTVRVVPGQGPACKDTFVISFFVPFEHQAAPPAPSDPDVTIEARLALDVAVSAFGGWAKGSTWLAKAADAAGALADAGIQVDNSFFYTAGYDSPFRLTGRHNEVWLPYSPASAPSKRASPAAALSTARATVAAS